MSDLNWELREHLHALREDDQLAVLLCIYLHRNIRNRAWPSNDLIHKETGVGKTTISGAIAKLLEKRAFLLVPYNKRVAEETKLPKRKNIYQLTGVMFIDGQSVEYMHLTPEGWEGIAVQLVELGESSLAGLLTPESSLAKLLAAKSLAGEHEGIYKSLEDSTSKDKGISPDGERTTNSSKKKEKKERKPPVHAPQHDALIAAFKLKPEQVTPGRDKSFWNVAAQLRKVNFPAEHIGALHTYIASRAKAEGWKSWGENALAKYAPDFMALHPERFNQQPQETPVETTTEVPDDVKPLDLTPEQWAQRATQFFNGRR